VVTPFIYLTAFTRGFSPATLVWDIPSDELGTQIRDFDGKFHGPVRLRIALANDYLAPAGSVLNQVGVENVWHTADQLGIQFPQKPAELGPSNLSIFRDVNLLEISHAFGIFANQGFLAGRVMSVENGSNGASIERHLAAPLEPISILYVDDSSGQVFLDWSDTQVRPIISPQLAYLLTDVLSDEGARWPSLGHPNEFEIGRPAAAKFSRTLSGDSNWAVGYTPQLVLSLWLGQDIAETVSNPSDPRLLQHATAGLWHAIIQYTSRDRPFQDWSVPAGITSYQVCDPSGMLPTKDCPNVVDEIFLAGNEPLQTDHLYKTLRVNSESGRLATVFTPFDQVEERPYFIVPSEASQWASQAGLEIPPKDYDAIPDQISNWEGVAITSPAMFDIIRGKVPVLGTASVDEFDSYRLQVGQGLNPQAWYQIGEDQSQPIQSGELGELDTSELSGLYALQLLVLSQDQSARRHTVLVTVDNAPPEVQITYPQGGEVIDISRGDTVVFQADIKDDLGVDSADFYIEDDLLGTLLQPPFAISWNAKPGTFSLLVEAKDQAGNVSKDSVTFVVE
jgi:membrane carboxypeptidase/penicillin-binding protein PbpC